MVGRIVGLVSFLLCAFPFFVVSVFDKDSAEPITFWAGDTSLKERLSDTRAYNMEMAGLYKKCAVAFVLTGLLFAVLPAAGIVLAGFDCSSGIYLAWKKYKEILARYSRI